MKNNKVLEVVDGYEFMLDTHQGVRGNDGAFTLKKPRHLIERYRSLASEFNQCKLAEVGLWDGGSTAFFSLIFKPKTLLGFELATKPLTELESFLEASSLKDNVHIHLGFDQADSSAMSAVVDKRCSGELDLVVDDASHLYQPTAITFDTLFPRVRPGGLYIIEDWSHEHQMASSISRAIQAGMVPEDKLAELKKGDMPKTPLSLLMLDIVLAAANGDGVVSEVLLQPGYAEIRRGDKELDPASFSLRDTIGALGRHVSPVQ